MAIVGFFFELSIAYFHFQLLAATTTAAARKVAVDVGPATTCVALEGLDDPANPNRAASKALNYLQTTFGLGANIGNCVRFCGNVIYRQEANGAGLCYIRIRGKWPIKCFFCIFYKGNWIMTADGESFIEDECFNQNCANAGACVESSQVYDCSNPNMVLRGGGPPPSEGLSNDCF